MRQFGSDDFERLFPNRKSKYSFLIRMLALVVMTGALLTSSFWAGGKPTAAIPTTASFASSPDTEDLSGRLDATGSLTKDVLVLSDDGIALLKLPNGTKVLDASGQPAASITVTAREVPLRSEIALVGQAYVFSPEGARLNPPVSLTLYYDPKAYYPFSYQDVDCSQMHMAYFNGGAPVVPWLAVSVDRNTDSVTAQIDHLGTFILFCEVFGPPLS